MDSESCNRTGDLSREDRIVVENQEPVGGVVGERLPNLLQDPASRWARGHVEMKDPAAPMIDREPDIEQMEADRRHDEEIHPCDHVLVVPQEGDPALVLAGFGFETLR